MKAYSQTASQPGKPLVNAHLGRAVNKLHRAGPPVQGSHRRFACLVVVCLRYSAGVRPQGRHFCREGQRTMGRLAEDKKTSQSSKDRHEDSFSQRWSKAHRNHAFWTILEAYLTTILNRAPAREFTGQHAVCK